MITNDVVHCPATLSNWRFYLILCGCLLWATPAFAFYSNEAGNRYIEARGELTLSTGFVDTKSLSAASGRLMLDGDQKNWHIEYHHLLEIDSRSRNSRQQLVDRLNISFNNAQVGIKVGRQAINLATTFFFSPNDFFQPFAAQAFIRDYKQGVDGAYATLQTGALSQLSAIAVDGPFNPSSVLRLDSVFKDLGWMVMAAQINPTNQQQNLQPVPQANVSQRVIAASVQADLFEQMALRAEGHISRQQHRNTTEWVVGLEYRGENDLSLQAEWFRHGAGKPTANLPYSGPTYLALGASYTFTPLLSGTVNSVHNVADHSQQQMIYLSYSLSDEGTLSAYGLIPSGSFASEFGNRPKLFGLEYQVYF